MRDKIPKGFGPEKTQSVNVFCSLMKKNQIKEAKLVLDFLGSLTGFRFIFTFFSIEKGFFT